MNKYPVTAMDKYLLSQKIIWTDVTFWFLVFFGFLVFDGPFWKFLIAIAGVAFVIFPTVVFLMHALKSYEA